jgi:hypothetical protein
MKNKISSRCEVVDAEKDGKIVSMCVSLLCGDDFCGECPKFVWCARTKRLLN